MSSVEYTQLDLEQNFSPLFLTSGKIFQRQGGVKELIINSNGKTLEALVQGTTKPHYSVQIKIDKLEKGQINFNTHCDCPSDLDCKHITAVLWAGLENSPQIVTNKLSSATHVHEHVDKIADENTPKNNDEINYPEDSDERIIYLLTLINQPRLMVQIEICLVHLLKSGDYGKPQAFNFGMLRHKHNILSVDKHICHWLAFSKPTQDAHIDPKFILQGAHGADLLHQIIETGRCHYGSHRTPALHTGPMRQAQLSWQTEPDGSQRLLCRVPGGSNTVLPLTPPWYIDHEQLTCGPIETGFDPSIVSALLIAPPLKPEQLKQMYLSLTKVPPPAQPKKFSSVRKHKVKPIPELRLFSAELELQPSEFSGGRPHWLRLSLAKLSFMYDQAHVDYGDIKNVASYIDHDELITVPRDFAVEHQAQHELEKRGLLPLHQADFLKFTNQQYTHYWLIRDAEDPQAQLDFSLYDVPELRGAGWQVYIDETYPFRLIQQTDEWYYGFDETRSQQWFNFELGITVDGENVNLLPILVEIIQNQYSHHRESFMRQISDDSKPFLVHLPDGRLLPIATARLRSILNVLTELYEVDNLTGANKLKLAKLRIAQLHLLEQALQAAKMRWFGGEKLRALGEKLTQFTGVKKVTPPDGLMTELRPYQLDGISWLQFLREFELGGVLADDMGLGKTVQALAHILYEKNSGRMKKPCLVIAPTSLMINWHQEAERFTPGLKILTLHGSERKPHFNTMSDYDVILTTYPLLIRDQEPLLAQQYHVLIIDEAQFIKNPRTKINQIVQKIHAAHRLCLTGTPMENHLGELWSLYNFLLPGLLGDSRQFQRLFRVPIEKHHDAERSNSLWQRIAPFFLRRTKQQVLQELPPKIEMLRTVELEGPQRDLYESIRISLHQKVASIVKDKGLANSQIIILDALLKLRQTCCDPRLLKMTSAQKLEAGSAKLTLLMEMLPNLIAEGRRILLFSQFTEMLQLIEEALNNAEITYVKLTGKTKDRKTPIDQFQSGQCNLFLISLKAGGTGLNLTAADTIIHYDPWWNPAVEKQATDRAHRIGQDKTVFVYKLITSGTVEEKILLLQQHKNALLENLLSHEASGLGGFKLEDLEALFQPLPEQE